MVLAAGAVAIWGWWQLWFLTDDAYIAFRYVSNSLRGWGLVWNPPPFRPVEGYSSFLWVVLLRAVWGGLGVAPPAAANVLSLGFGLGTLAVVSAWIGRLALPPGLARWRPLFLALALAGVVTNRTFLTWLSSGLETALFNLLVVSWAWVGTRRWDLRSTRGVAALCGLAAALALTRPDGLLFCGASLALLGLLALGPPRLRGRSLWPAAFLLVVPLHLAWRLATYGAWLPNTYHAKYVAPWPESGVRYLASFLLENGVWVWLLLLLGAGALGWTRGAARRAAGAGPGAVVVATLAAHAAYYCFVIGGDHFEYRVLSYAVPLLFVSAVALSARLFASPAAAAAALAAFVLASWPIAWIHWWETRQLGRHEGAHVLIHPVAGRFPGWLRPVVGRFDAWQAWLIERHVGMRHQEHKALYEEFLHFWPSREVGSRLRWAERPVLAGRTVGMASWVYPEVAIIDLLGLNDRVIARTPVRGGGMRLMAHERQPPPGYVECFRPNGRWTGRRFEFVSRARPLTDAEIRACEARAWPAVSP